MNSVIFLALTIASSTLLLNRVACQIECDLKSCENQCMSLNAWRWSCEGEGCLCTFHLDDAKALCEKGGGIAGGSGGGSGGGGGNEPDKKKKDQEHDYDDDYDDIFYDDNHDGGSRETGRPPGGQGGGKKTTKTPARARPSSLSLLPRKALEPTNGGGGSRVGKVGKMHMPFVVKSLHMPLSSKQVMEQLKRQKGDIPMRKIEDFLRKGGR
ncbi:hypothetical protein HPB52_002739 [Rhipicephalus sanguineus]|uniref:Secreted protein n=1 Tax=Rhipicephalus sanguineus TaxID=34632 RepID=A0A9D4PHN7_RHISA|nr:hypothetical protein HPB52_002739 [Rhipicephalus sanguineus]